MSRPRTHAELCKELEEWTERRIIGPDGSPLHQQVELLELLGAALEALEDSQGRETTTWGSYVDERSKRLEAERALRAVSYELAKLRRRPLPRSGARRRGGVA